MKTTHPTFLRASLTAGLGLATALGAVGLVRRDRPLHAYGTGYDGRLEIDRAAGVGLPLLDSAGSTAVVARVSRAMSVSHRGPDIIGLAIRTDEAADLLFASTGRGLLGRYTLRLHTRPDAGLLTTLLPLCSPSGPVQLSLSPAGDKTWTLAWSRPRRRTWTELGTLTLSGERPDPGHFDPTGNPPAGLTPPAWVRLLRAPAYWVARRLPNQVPDGVRP